MTDREWNQEAYNLPQTQVNVRYIYRPLRKKKFRSKMQSEVQIHLVDDASHCGEANAKRAVRESVLLVPP
jgi:hypothetical protein